MAYFVIKIIIALGLLSLAGLVLTILKPKKLVNDSKKQERDDWDQF